MLVAMSATHGTMASATTTDRSHIWPARMKLARL